VKIEVILTIVIAYLAVIIAHGEFSIAPSVFTILLLVAVALTVMKRFRAKLFDVTVLTSATFIIAFAARYPGMGSMLASLTKILGWWSIIWLPVLVLSCAAEAIAVVGGIAKQFGATCVAAAAFMIFPQAGTDVITPYHDSVSKWIIAGAVVIAAAEKDKIPERILIVTRILGPFLIVTFGWLIVLLDARDWPGWRIARDPQWLLPVIALPASMAVIVVEVVRRYARTTRSSSRVR